MNLLLTNARVYTVNPRQPRASAIAIAGNRILAVGSDEDIEAIRLPDMQRLNMHGAFVLPGLIDAHLHLEHTGFAMQRVNVDEVPSVEEAVRRVRDRAARTPPGEWIEGWGWQQAIWGGRFPTSAQLDAATQAHPVALRAKSGHALWANSLALRIAGVTRETPDPAGGEIVRDAQGEPTGVLLESAMALVARVIPPPTPQQEEEATLLAMRAMNAAGLTGVHCMDGAGGIGTFNTYQRLREQGRSTLRICKQLPVEDLDAIIGAGLRSGFGDAWLRIGGIKIFADGALGPRTAWMIAPYEGEPGNYGIALYDSEQLVELVTKAHAHGLSATTHAIGDRANRAVLDAYARVTQDDRPPSPIRRPLRDRIEHAQVLHPDDVARFGRLGVIASVQPIHATQDMFMVDRYWGRRGRYAYAFRDLLNGGARLALGSDSPVETFDPLVGIHAAVTRRRRDGTPEGGWYPDQRLTIEEAIYGYTMGAAYAGYSEHELGSIEPGKLADLTVLSHDLTAIPPEDILNVKVERVMVDGKFRIGIEGQEK
ncbi:MAG: amidohydrolase [Candidatus Roseilinea sp.]|nr:MAG: amidohydrolase [Candidatus Roseilinea sp.]